MFFFLSCQKQGRKGKKKKRGEKGSPPRNLNRKLERKRDGGKGGPFLLPLGLGDRIQKKEEGGERCLPITLEKRKEGK